MGDTFTIVLVSAVVLYIMPLGIGPCEDDKEEGSVCFFLDCWSALWFAGLVNYYLIDKDALSILDLDYVIAIMVITFSLILAFLLHLLVLSKLRKLFKKLFAIIGKKAASSSLTITKTSQS